MALTGEEFDQICEKIESVMEQVARKYVERKYDIDTSNWDSDALLLIVREILHKEKVDYERKVKVKELLEEVQTPNRPTPYEINRVEVRSDTFDNTYQDDPFSEGEDELYDENLIFHYSFGEMLDELIYVETSWRRSGWKEGVHVRLFEIPGKSRLIVKGKNGFYSQYEPNQEDLMATDWDLLEEASL